MANVRQVYCLCLVVFFLETTMINLYPAPAAQNQQKPGVAAKIPVPYDFGAERGPHHRRRMIVQERFDKQAGVFVSTTNEVVEISTGLHYFDQAQWKPSEERIEPVPGGAVARRGQHQVFFAANLNSAGAISFTSPDGRQLKSHPLGLAYYDATSGKSVLLSPLKNSQGRIEEERRVMYADAFQDIEADVVYHYSKQGLAQWIILRQRPPNPQLFGLNPATTRLEAWTEFLDPLEPRQTLTTLNQELDITKRVQMVEPDFIDEYLEFGTLHMVEGKAFEANRDLAWDVPVAKSWRKINQRHILIEAIQLPLVQDRLIKLPLRAAVDPGLRASMGRELPQAATASVTRSEPMLIASNTKEREGFVLDYSVVHSTSTALDLKPGVTYRITGTVICTAPVHFGKDVVLKYDRGARFVVQNAAVSAPGNVYLLAVDDPTRGDFMGSGNVVGKYAHGALVLQAAPAATSLGRFHIRDAKVGVEVSSGLGSLSLDNFHWTRCETGVAAYFSTVTINGGSMCDVGTPYSNLGYATIVPNGTAVEAGCRDDHGNILSAATPATVGAAAGGSISPAGDDDWFKVTVVQSGYLSVYTLGTTDTYGMLFDANGLLLDRNDDSTDHNFNIKRFVAPGTYHVCVRHYNQTSGTGEYSFVPYLQIGNRPPWISIIPNQTTVSGIPLGPFAFQISDGETLAGALSVSVSSSDPSLIPEPNIVLGGSGENRTLQITPVAGKTGAVAITVTVSDGQLSAAARFQVDVIPPTGPPGQSSLLNLNFGGSYSPLFTKSGPAAIGNNGDYWNDAIYSATYLNLMWADRSPSGIQATLSSDGIWTIAANSDPMYRVYSFRLDGNIEIRLDRVPAGLYDLYLYGHGDHATQVGIFSVTASGASQGMKQTAASGDYSRAGWTEGIHYTVFRNVPISGINPTLVITASPAESPPHGSFLARFAVVNGLQLLSKPVEVVATPTINPQGGSFSGTRSVTMACATPGAVIRYTTNGQEPSESSAVIPAPFVLTTSVVLKVKAFRTGWVPSGTATATFTQLDADADGLPDAWEQQYFGTLVQSPTADTDSDRLSNLDEFKLGTNPAQRDSNGNGVEDAFEDPDSDRLPNLFEIRARTSPLTGDSDGDGIEDALEDGDADGWMNFEELVLEMNPSANDPPRCIVNVAVLDSVCKEQFTDTGSFLLSRAGSVAKELRVQISLKGTADNGDDYQTIGTEVGFAPGEAYARVPLLPLDDAEFEGDERVTLVIHPDLAYSLGTATQASITITDNDRPTVGVVAMDSQVAEMASVPAEFKFDREGNIDAPLTISLQWSGTAVAGSDYSAFPNTITFSARESSITLGLIPSDDAISEGRESVLVSILPAAHYLVQTGSESAAIQIVDNDLPIITVSSDGQDKVTEGTATSARFVFTRTGSGDYPITVSFIMRGTAGAGDVTQSKKSIPSFPESVVIPGGGPRGSAALEFEAVDDFETELIESIKVTLAAGVDYKVGAANEASIQIYDNEPTTLTYEMVAATSIRGPDIPAEIKLLRKGSLESLQDFRLVMSEFSGNMVTIAGQSVRKMNGRLGLPGKFFQGNVHNISSPFGSILSYPYIVRFQPQMAEARVRLHYFDGPFGIILPTRMELAVFPVAAAVGIDFPENAPLLLVPFGFHGAERLISIETSSASTAVAEAGTLTLTFRRNNNHSPWLPVAALSPLNVAVRVYGSAQPGLDHDLLDAQILLGTKPQEYPSPWGSVGTSRAGTVSFPAAVSTVNLPVKVHDDRVSEGWESLRVELDRTSTDYAVLVDATHPPIVAFNIRDLTTTGPEPPLDRDGDGLSDQFETRFGYDPFTSNDPYQDGDKDGLPDIDEDAFGTNPLLGDSDLDGTNDGLEARHGTDPTHADSSSTLDPDNYSKIKLTVASCFKCHSTTLQVGPHSLTSQDPARVKFGTSPERSAIHRFAKGKTYPIRIKGSVLEDPSATYTAFIQPAEPGQPRGYLLLDPDKVLGNERPVQGPVPEKHVRDKLATLYVPKLEIRVDANRDRTINFDSSDATKAEQPYRFWINNDSDFGSEDDAEDREPLIVNRNNADARIDGLRDLEDFTRLHIRLEGLTPDEIKSPRFSMRLKWIDSAHAPTVRFFKSEDPSGSLNYLQDVDGGRRQAFSFIPRPPGLVSPTEQLSWTIGFTPSSSSNIILEALLFEGVEKGSGALVAELLLDDEVICRSPPCYLRIDSANEFIDHWTVGDSTKISYDMIPGTADRAGDSGLPHPRLKESPDYILSVHGWRMEPWERRSFALTAFKRLWWEGYKGRFGLFSWPTEWIELNAWYHKVLSLGDARNFDRSERNAWISGRPLAKLLARLEQKHPGRVRLIAHSMGNIVAGEALMQLTESGRPNVVHTYIAMQAAVASHLYDSTAPSRTLTAIGGVGDLDSKTRNVYANYYEQNTTPKSYKPYFWEIRGAQRFYNYYNILDPALDLWNLGQGLKPDLFYHYDPWYGFFTGPDPWIPNETPFYISRRLTIPRDRFEIFAHAAEARCVALGAQPHVRTDFENTSELNLNATFGWEDNAWDHSAQYLSIIANRAEFWRQIINHLGL